MKIVINTCYGGFSLSEAAMFRYAELKGLTLYKEITHSAVAVYWTIPEDRRPSRKENVEAYNRAYREYTLSAFNIPRNDVHLVQVVEELGKAADGSFAELKVVEIPADVDWEIAEYDGNEWITEKHRTWS
jgi:hypothetical protein